MYTLRLYLSLAAKIFVAAPVAPSGIRSHTNQHGGDVADSATGPAAISRGSLAQLRCRLF